MKAIDAYRDVLKELDKFESPTFSIRDFNYFYPKAVMSYITDNYKVFDVVQKDVDDARWFLPETPADLTFDSSGVADLPDDYLDVLKLTVNLKFTKDFARWKKDNIVLLYPERLKSGQEGFRFKNAFGRPNARRCYYDIAKDKIRLYFDSTVHTLVTGSPNAKLHYILQPDDVYLNPDKGSDYNDPANNSVLIFSPEDGVRTRSYYEIVNVCRRIFLENIESQRFPEAVRETQVQ